MSTKKAWESYGSKVFLGLAFLLVGALSFEAGLLQKSLAQPAPVIIRVNEPVVEVTQPLLPADGTPSPIPSETKASSDPSSCQFVGSKNSNKYHHPSSRCAKQIKPENKRCFNSVEDAKAKGYLAGCLTP